MPKSACEVFWVFNGSCLGLTESFEKPFGMRQSQWMKVGFSLVRIPIEMGDKFPREKEGTDALILATWGCHTVGGCQIKLWGRQAKQVNGGCLFSL